MCKQGLTRRSLVKAEMDGREKTDINLTCSLPPSSCFGEDKTKAETC